MRNYLRVGNGKNLQFTPYSVIHTFSLTEEDPKDVWRPKDLEFEETGERTATVNGLAFAF